MDSKEEKTGTENKPDKKPFKDIKDLMAQIYGEDSEEFKRLENEKLW